MADPSSGSILRTNIGAPLEETFDEAPEQKKKKRIKDVGVLEGREETVKFLHAPPTRKDDEEQWAFLVCTLDEFAYAFGIGVDRWVDTGGKSQEAQASQARRC